MGVLCARVCNFVGLCMWLCVRGRSTWTKRVCAWERTRKDDERDACKSKIRGRVCVCVRVKEKEIMSKTAGGKNAERRGWTQLEWQRWAFFWHKLISAWARSSHLSSTSPRLFAYRCESYQLIKLLGFLPVPCLILPFMCLAKSKGAAWHITPSTRLPGFDPSFLYPSFLLQYLSLWHSFVRRLRVHSCLFGNTAAAPKT